MNGSRSNHILIKTPEGVAFSLQLASPVLRLLAWGVDVLLIFAAWLGLSLGLSSLGWLGGFAQALYYLSFFAISIGYGIGAEWFWRGQTLGKRLFRLRVMDAQGLKLQFNQIVLRNLLRFLDSLPLCYLVGGIACLLSRKIQRLGDRAANTIVIYSPLLSEPDLEQLMSGKFNSLRRYPHLAGRLRQRTLPPEASLAMNALLRRDQLADEARLDLFREIARHFAAKSPFPADATEGITDEQFVRNVVELLYRTGEGAPAKSPPQLQTPKSSA